MHGAFYLILIVLLYSIIFSVLYQSIVTKVTGYGTLKFSNVVIA